MIIPGNIPILKRNLIIFAVFLFAAGTPSTAQNLTGVTEKILAIVGKNRIILKSDLDLQFAQVQAQDPNVSDTVKCYLLQQMVLQKLLTEQAERDSLLVSDEDVEGTLDNRIRYYIRQYGSKEKLEEIAGKTVYQLKEDQKEFVKEQMMAEKMQQKVLQNVKITPSEVQTFFNKHPQDSLPFFPATVEVGQIVIDPPVSQELDMAAKEKIEGIKDRIVKGGESFEILAGIYSDDPGSRDNGGRYNDVTRKGGFDPAFVAAAFRLQNGEVSPVIKTSFGYHIIQMIQRKGDAADLRHILIRQQRTSADFKKALMKLDSVRSLLVAGNISFPEAVGKYSSDESVKHTGGMISDPQSGATELEIEKLDPSMVLMIDTLKPGSFSQPQVFVTDRGEQSSRIVYLKSRTEPHRANLRDDYSKIQQVALQEKQQRVLEQWVKDRLPNYYIRIDEEYRSCKSFKDWRLAGN